MNLLWRVPVGRDSQPCFLAELRGYACGNACSRVRNNSGPTLRIIDVKTLYGVESVKETQGIDMVIKLEEWDKDKDYDRLGLNEEYTEFLGNKVVCHSLPIRPGRNLAVIVEAAAVNHRQKKMGYNAAQELYRRVQENMMKKREEGDE